MNNSIEKASVELKENNNNLQIEKEILENDISNLKKTSDKDKTTIVTLKERIDELEGKFLLFFINFN
jgi:FtsZ-binding cell division protein ZapB